MVLAASVHCGEAESGVASDLADAATPDSRSTRDASADAAPRGGHTPNDDLVRCGARPRALAGIADVVVRLNELVPADGPCLVAALPRPLALVATTGALSAQPAGGKGSPRLFFLLPKLVVSAVPSGRGSTTVEFGEWVTNLRTLKGELPLPVNAAIAPDAPYAQVLDARRMGTTCGTCHRNEESHRSIAGAFVSDAFKPEALTGVPLSELEGYHEACTLEADTSARCAMLHAVFDFGEVVQGAFAPEVGTASFN